MAILHVQDAGTTFSSASSTAPAFTSNATVGNTVVGVLTLNSNTATISSISGLGATWLQITDFIDPNLGAMHIAMFIGVIVTGSLKIVTVNFSTSVTGCINIQEFSGCSQQIDAVTFKGGGSSASPNSNAITPASANTLIIYSLMTLAAPTITAPASGWTVLTKLAAGTTNSLSTIWQIQTTRTAEFPVWTLGTAEATVLTGVALQAVGTTSAAYIRQARGSDAATTPCATLPLTPLAGSALIGSVGISGGAAITGVTDGTNTWTKAGSVTNAGNATAGIYYQLSVTNVALTPSVAYTSGAIPGTIFVAEWVNITAFDAVGAGTTGTSTAPSDGGVTSTNANDVIVSTVTTATATHESAGQTAGYGSAAAAASQSGAQYGGYTIKSSTGTYTDTHTTGSVAWAGIAAAFKYSAGIARAMAAVWGSASGVSPSPNVFRPITGHPASLSGFAPSLKAFRPIAVAFGSASGVAVTAVAPNVKRPLIAHPASTSGVAAALAATRVLKAVVGSISGSGPMLALIRTIAGGLGSFSGLSSGLRLTVVRGLVTVFGSVSGIVGALSVAGGQVIVTLVATVTSASGLIASLADTRAIAAVSGSVSGLSNPLSAVRALVCSQSIGSVSGVAVTANILRGLVGDAATSASGLAADLTSQIIVTMVALVATIASASDLSSSSLSVLREFASIISQCPSIAMRLMSGSFRKHHLSGPPGESGGQ